MKYLSGYAPHLLDRVRALIDEGTLGASVRKRYPETHDVRSDPALYAYVMDLKNRHMRSAPPVSKVAYDPRLHILHNALGTHTTISRVQGDKLRTSREIRIATVFRDAPAVSGTVPRPHQGHRPGGVAREDRGSEVLSTLAAHLQDILQRLVREHRRNGSEGAFPTQRHLRLGIDHNRRGEEIRVRVRGERGSGFQQPAPLGHGFLHQLLRLPNRRRQGQAHPGGRIALGQRQEPALVVLFRSR